MDKKDLSVMIVVSVNRNGGFGGEGLPIHQEHLVVPLDRIGAVDPGDMVRRAVANVVHVAGYDQEDKEDGDGPVSLKHAAKKKT